MIPSFKYSTVAVLVAAASFNAAARTVNARLVYFTPSADDPAELYVAGQTEGELVKCEPSSSVTRDPATCQVDASGKVVFFKTATGGEVVATATVPAGVSQAVFFFLRSPKPEQKNTSFQVLVADESPKVLPKGGSFACNVAPLSARLTIGEFKYELPPGKSVHLNRPKIDASNMAPFRVQIQVGDSWMPIKDSTLRFAENERYFLIIYRDDGTRSVVKIYKQAVFATSSQSQ